MCVCGGGGGLVILITGEGDDRFDPILGSRLRGVVSPCPGSWNSSLDFNGFHCPPFPVPLH